MKSYGSNTYNEDAICKNTAGLIQKFRGEREPPWMLSLLLLRQKQGAVEAHDSLISRHQTGVTQGTAKESKYQDLSHSPHSY